MSSQPLRPPTPSSESERSRTSISDDFENLSGIPLTPFEHTFPPRPHSHSGHHRSGLENGIRNRGGDDGEMEKFDRRELAMMIGSTLGVLALSGAALCITLLNIML
ncbi:hypothetical protein FRC02_011669 [Tulasnella sp. 418]|nr:hypothetical protein FRC02_011669 [Tulasnella sp. 418]